MVLFNSRTAIAGTIIGRLLIFHNPKNLDCIGVLCFLVSKNCIVLVLCLFKDVFTPFFMTLSFQNGINRYSSAGINFHSMPLATISSDSSA